MRTTLEERARYHFTATQHDAGEATIRVEDPTGRSWAQWWIFPAEPRFVTRRAGGRYGRKYVVRVETFKLCASPNPHGHGLVTYTSFDAAYRGAELRARTWLGSKWGLKTAARRLP